MNDFRKVAYSVLKWACLVGLPALVVLFTSLGGIWGWTWVPEVCASISAIDVCLGTWIGVVFTKSEKSVDGGVVVDKEGKIVDIVADDPDKDIAKDKDIVKLAVFKDEDNPYSGE